MFASKRGKKMFVRIMGFSWLVLVFQKISLKLYLSGDCKWSIFSPYLLVAMALLIFLCNSKPERKLWQISFSVLTEILLISIPMIYFWPLIRLLYLSMKYETVVTTGPDVTYLHWIFLALGSIPIVAFLILRKWKEKELQ